MKKIFYFILFFSILFNLSLLSYSFQNREKNIFYIKNIENFHTLDIMENSISKQIPNSSHLIELEKDSSKVENDNVEFAQSILNLFSFFSIIIPLFIVISLIIIFYLKMVCKIIKKISEAFPSFSRCFSSPLLIHHCCPLKLQTLLIISTPNCKGKPFSESWSAPLRCGTSNFRFG